MDFNADELKDCGVFFVDEQTSMIYSVVEHSNASNDFISSLNRDLELNKIEVFSPTNGNQLNLPSSNNIQTK